MAVPTAVTPQDIYNALLQAGASTPQAIGIMANMINESNLNVETGQGGTVIDSNGYPVYGLVSWNTQDYPDAGSLVTGNPQADLKAQIAYLAKTGGFQAATGSDGSQSAANFAQNYEKCQGCTPGGSQYNQRVGNAATVQQWVAAGSWPTSAGQAQAQAQQQSSSDPSVCLLPFSFLGSGSCLFSKTQARALTGGLMLLGGGLLGVVALLILASYGLKQTAPGRAAMDAVKAIPFIPPIAV